MANDRLEARRQRQREQALATGISNRQKRAALKRLIRAGDVDPLALVAGRLDKYEDDVQGWKLPQLLACVPGVGPALTHELIEAFRATPTQKMRAFSFQRREELAQLVADATGRTPLK